MSLTCYFIDRANDSPASSYHPLPPPYRLANIAHIIGNAGDKILAVQQVRPELAGAGRWEPERQTDDGDVFPHRINRLASRAKCAREKGSEDR